MEAKTPVAAAAAASLSAPFRRRTLLKAALGGAAALGAGPLLAACTSDTGSPAGGGNSGGNPATVRMWSWYGEQKDEFPKLVGKFQEQEPQHQGRESRLRYPGPVPARPSGGSRGRRLPEIFAPHTRALTYGTGGISADLKPALGDEFLADIFESANQEYTLDGKQYAIGWMAQTFGIFYNPDLLQRAGVDPESIETWDDLIAAAPKVKASGKYGVSISCNPTTSSLDFFLPLLTQVSDDPTFFLKLDQQQDGLTWEDPTVVKAIELNKRIVDAGVFQPGTTGTSGDQAPQIFYTEKSAMLFNGSWSPQGFVQNASKEFVAKYKVMKTPAISAGAKHWTANQAGAGWAVAETSKNKDAALTFLKWLYDPEPVLPHHEQLELDAGHQERCGADQEPDHEADDVLADRRRRLPAHPVRQRHRLAAGDPLSQIFEGKGDPADVAKQMQAAVLNASG